jgi:hypothetical protein
MPTNDQLRATNAHLEEAIQLVRDAPDSMLYHLLEMASQEIWEQLRRTAPRADRRVYATAEFALTILDPRD